MNLLADEAGKVVEGELYGATLYELEPGRSSPYHWHAGEEEFLVVVSGTPTLRTPEGERELRPWDAAWFVRGEAGAHQLRNDTDGPARVLFFSTRSDPELAVYPDDGKVGVIADWSTDDRETKRGWVELE